MWGESHEATFRVLRCFVFLGGLGGADDVRADTGASTRVRVGDREPDTDNRWDRGNTSIRTAGHDAFDGPGRSAHAAGSTNGPHCGRGHAVTGLDADRGHGSVRRGAFVARSARERRASADEPGSGATGCRLW
jgi:hypothetical protein